MSQTMAQPVTQQRMDQLLDAENKVNSVFREDLRKFMNKQCREKTYVQNNPLIKYAIGGAVVFVVVFLYMYIIGEFLQKNDEMSTFKQKFASFLLGLIASSKILISLHSKGFI
jgi:hypothetical protein